MRPVPGHPLYFVTHWGQVFSAVKHRIHELQQLRGSSGRKYRYVNLGRGCRIGVHQLVAMCFLPPPVEVDGVMQALVRHLDNNPSNNHVDNLAWGTQAQNLADRKAHGTMTWGSVNGASKVTEQIVAEIRTRRRAGERCREIAAELGLSPSQVHRIGLGQRWAHISGDLAPRERTRKESQCLS